MVLAFAVIAAGLTGPGQTIGVSVFIDHLVGDLSLSRSQVSTAYLIGTLTGATLLPSVGKLIDRRGVRVSQVLIGLLFGLALVNMSFVNGLVWLAIGFGGIRFLGQGSLSLVSTVTVQLRFDRTRGTALGIFTTASAGVMALVPVALAVVISAVGWRNAWLVSAAVVAALVVPIAWFGLRDLPTGTCTTVRVDPSVEIGGRADTDSFERGEAMRTASFWMLAAVSGAAGMMSTALNFHQIDLLGDAGLSEKAAAALFIPQVVGSTVAGLTIGYVGDRIGTRYLPAIGMALLLAAQLLAAVAAPGIVVIIYAVVLGATGGATRTASATLQPQWFGTGHIGSIQGALTLFAVGASAIGPVALTLAEQWMGSYPPAVALLGVVPVAALLFALGPNTGPTHRSN
jgi:MFS family permease